MNRNRPLRISPGTTAQRILRAISYSGEIPNSKRGLLAINPEQFQRTLKRLDNENYIRRTRVLGYSTIRITPKGLEALRKADPHAAEFFATLSGTTFSGGRHNGNGSSGSQRTRRRWRRFVIGAFMDRLGVAYFTGDKPPLLTTDMASCSVKKGQCVYYTSIELKRADPLQHKKFDFTRVAGVLVCPGGVFTVYSVDANVRLRRSGEYKAMPILENILYATCEQVREVSGFHLNRAIVIGSPELGALMEDMNQQSGQLSLYELCEHVHYLPDREEGIQMLRILLRENSASCLRYLAYADGEKASFPSLDIDAIQEDGRLSMQFLDGDIVRLRRFLLYAASHPDTEFEVLCYDFQADELEAYTPNNVELSRVTLEQVVQLMDDLFPFEVR